MKNSLWGCGLLLGLVAFGCSSTTGDNSGSSDMNLCSEQYDALNVRCPLPDSRQANVQACISDQREFAGIGCESQYDAWLVCTMTAGYDCSNDTGCEVTQGAYFSCQSQATARTGCVRLASQDAVRCSDDGKPYAFSCTAAASS